MYNEPHHDEEQYRLKRKDEDDNGGFNAGMFLGWILAPAVTGMVIATILTVIVPSLVTSMSRKASFDVMADNLLKALNQEFSLLVAMKWGDTNLWIYLLCGALIGILIKYFFSDEKIS